MTSLSSVTKKELKGGLIERDEVVDQKGLVTELRALFSQLRLKDSECSFILHDERSYTLRLTIPQTKDDLTVSELIKKQISPLVPEPFGNLTLAFKTLETGREGEVQIVVVNRKILAKYLTVFRELGLRPRLAVPESYALHSLLSPTIGRGETVIYLDPETEAANAIILDRLGVVETFTERDLEKIKRFASEKWGRKIERILGPKSLGDLSKTYPLSMRAKLSPSQIGEFASLLGLALLTRQKEPLNFLPA